MALAIWQSIQDRSDVSQFSNACYHSVSLACSHSVLYCFIISISLKMMYACVHAHMCLYVYACTWAHVCCSTHAHVKARCSLGIFFFACLCACQMLLSPCDFIEIGSLWTWSSPFCQYWLTSYLSISVLARASVLGGYNWTRLLCGFWGSKLRLPCLIESVLLTDSFFPAPNMLFI